MKSSSRVNRADLQRQSATTAQLVAKSTASGPLQRLIDGSPRVIAQRQQVNGYAQPTLPGQVVQRYRDVVAEYKDRQIVESRLGSTTTYMDEDVKMEFLTDYQKIQQFLANKKQVKKHLKKLDKSLKNYKGEQKQGRLSRALQDNERGTFSAELPTCIGFVPGEIFEEMMQRDELFEDTVGVAHGVQSHRIQWYLIKQHAAKNPSWLTHTTEELYRDITTAKWYIDAGKGRMWDAVLDGGGTESKKGEVNTGGFNFTKPDFIEQYLSESKPFHRLGKEIKLYGDQVREKRKYYQEYWRAQATADDKKAAGADKSVRIQVGEYTFTGFLNADEPTLVYHNDPKNVIRTWQKQELVA